MLCSSKFKFSKTDFNFAFLNNFYFCEMQNRCFCSNLNGGEVSSKLKGVISLANMRLNYLNNPNGSLSN